MKRSSFKWTCLTILTFALTGCDSQVKSPPATTDAAGGPRDAAAAAAPNPVAPPARVVAGGSPQDTAAAKPAAEPVYKVVSPVGENLVKMTAMAPRLETLAGKTVGLVWNHAFKADVTLPAIGEELKKRYPTVKIVMYDALPIAPLPDTGTPGKEALALQAAMKAKGCDAIIAGNGG